MYLTTHPVLVDVYCTALLVGALWILLVLITLPEADRPTPTVLERWLHRVAARKANRRPLPPGCERLPVPCLQRVRMALAWSQVDAHVPTVRVAPAALAAFVMLVLSSLPATGHPDYVAWVVSTGFSLATLGAVVAVRGRAVKRRRPINVHVVGHLVTTLDSLDEAQTPADGYEAPGHRTVRALDDLELALVTFVDKRFTADPLTRRHLRDEVGTTIAALRVHEREVLRHGPADDLRGLLLRLLAGWAEGNYDAPAEAVAAVTGATEPARIGIVGASPGGVGRLLVPVGIVLAVLVPVVWLCGAAGLTDDLNTMVVVTSLCTSLLAIGEVFRRARNGEHPAEGAPRRLPAARWTGAAEGARAQLPEQVPSEPR